MPNETLWFDYELPRQLVAQEPLRHRADARLMVVDRRRQEIEHHHVRDLPHLLPSGDRLVLNDTKVIPAQLAGKRLPTGGRWQGLFLEATSDGHWRILCKTRGHLHPGDAITLIDREGRPGVKLWLIERLEEGQWLAHAETDEPTEALLEAVGTRAAAAVHPRRQHGRRRRRQLSNRVCPAAGRDRRPDRRAALHQGIVAIARSPRRRHLGRYAARRAGHVSPDREPKDWKTTACTASGAK